MCMFSSFGSFGSIISAVFQRFAVFASSSDCARRRSSCSRSSGVSSAPKSSASNIWRISTSVSSLWGLGQRLTHSIASSFDFTCHSQKPASSSLVSAKGPSITVRLPPENLTRAPLVLGWSPSPASITPAFTSSSLNLPISVSSCSLGITPASESLVALIKIMNRIFVSPIVRRRRASRRGRRKVLQLEKRADLALALRAKAPRGVNLHESLGPLDRLGLRRELEDRVAGDQLLRFREGPVDHRALASGVPDPRPLRAGLEPFARKDHPVLHPFLKERPHGGQELFVREDARLRVLVGPEDAHVPDRSRLPGGRGRAELLLFLPPSVGLLGGVDREVRQFEQRANLDLAFLEGDAFGPFDGFLLRFRLDQPETGDQFLRLSEGPVDDLELSVGIPDAGALGARLEPVSREQRAGLD